MARRLDITAVQALAGAALVVGVTGCTAAPPPVASAAPSTAPDETAPATQSAMPTLSPDLTASENLPFFDAVNLGVVAANASAGGRDFIDALVAAGFDKSQMEVTADRTTVDLQAGSVQLRCCSATSASWASTARLPADTTVPYGPHWVPGAVSSARRDP